MRGDGEFTSMLRRWVEFESVAYSPWPTFIGWEAGRPFIVCLMEVPGDQGVVVEEVSENNRPVSDRSTESAESRG